MLKRRRNDNAIKRIAQLDLNHSRCNAAVQHQLANAPFKQFATPITDTLGELDAIALLQQTCLEECH